MKKMKTKIIGILMATIMLAFVMVAMVPTGTAVHDVANGGAFIIGETNVSFNTTVWTLNGTLSLKGPTETVGSVGKNTTYKVFTTYLDTTTVEGLINAQYYVINGTTGEVITVSAAEPSFTLKTKDLLGDTVTSISKDGSISISVQSNLDIINSTTNVTVKITDPDGVKRDISDVQLIGGAKEVTFTGTDKVGEYTVWVKTAKTTCNGLDKESASIKFTVLEPGVTLTSDKTEQAKGGEIIFGGTTSPYKLVNLTVSSGDATMIWFVGGKGDLATSKNPANKTDGTSVTASKAGAYSFVCNFTDTGSYEIKAEIDDAGYTAKVAVSIVSATATVTTDKTSYGIGESVVISGTSNIGDSVAIGIDGAVEKVATITADNTFEYKWPTDKKAAGSYKIEVWIVPQTLSVANSTVDVSPTKVADATTSILLTSPGLTAKIDKTVTAVGDDIVISGTALGADQVELISVAPKGNDGKNLEGTTNYLQKTIGVSSVDYIFSKKITISSSAATGSHLVAVFTPGGDGYYGRNSTADTIAKAIAPYNLAGKTQAQVMAILQDATINAAGSDDLMWIAYLKVESPTIALDTLADMAVGEPLEVTGTCNRVKYPILVTVSDSTTTVATESVTVAEGKFSVSFDTTGWTIGTYTVKADDGDGHTDDATMEILTAAPVATATPVPTAAPTATPYVPTPTPATPTPAPAPPTPEPPGFEAVFAIAGLLAVAYLVLRIKK